MKKLLILSGKGGTGKTTTAAAFIDFSEAEAFADCDVDAPNLHLLAGMKEKPQKTDYYGSEKASIDDKKCSSCGVCYQNCRFQGIIRTGGKYSVDPFACEGCGVCMYTCPAGAVTMEEDVAGELALYQEERLFSTAKLKMGRGNSGKLVTEVKKQLEQGEYGEFTIIDGSPGIGCPVIASISGVDMVLIVAEPSLSGISDMMRIIKTAGIFQIRTAVCINKYDTCIENTEEIKNLCQREDIPFVGCIPYDNKVSDAINEGHSIAKINCPARDALYQVYEKMKVYF
ncbi:nucleotide-binding protein [Anaerotignum sp.]|uniref:nucleotide-binding protein n=1 Tax=Anaerotignum sp. TaxID=2039241 RepID=UPI00289A2172|nr:4Fe-4S binding protein [Anaerotignum sp.]